VSALDLIKAAGTIGPDYTRTGKPSGKIVCADGFHLSVQAGNGVYCSPRPGGFALEDPEASYDGPYTAAEVGFPSERPEPWSQWVEFAEAKDAPTETVYGWVPFVMIEALVALHGGEKE